MAFSTGTGEKLTTNPTLLRTIHSTTPIRHPFTTVEYTVFHPSTPPNYCMVLLQLRKIQELFFRTPQKRSEKRLHPSRATQGVDHSPGGRARGAGADST